MAALAGYGPVLEIVCGKRCVLAEVPQVSVDGSVRFRQMGLSSATSNQEVATWVERAAEKGPFRLPTEQEAWKLFAGTTHDNWVAVYYRGRSLWCLYYKNGVLTSAPDNPAMRWTRQREFLVVDFGT